MWSGRPAGSLASHAGLLQNEQAASPVLRVFLSGAERLVGLFGRGVQRPRSLRTLAVPTTDCVVPGVSGCVLSEDWLGCNFGPLKFLCALGTGVPAQITALYLKAYPGGAFRCASTAPVSGEPDRPTPSERALEARGRGALALRLPPGDPLGWPQLFCGIHPELLSASCTNGSFWCSHPGAQRAAPRVPPPVGSGRAKLPLWLRGALLRAAAGGPGSSSQGSEAIT